MPEILSDDKYVVKLDVFEGPLDLLLHLIRKHELDIFDIPMAFITSKYLEYLDLMQQMNLDLAAEYLEMAATLTYIKSKMLLPSESTEDDEMPEEGPDPREELVRRLLEYQKYKTAADDLASMPMLGRDTFPRGASEEVEVERDLAAPDLFALMEAFQKLLSKAEHKPLHEVSITRITVSARINQLIDVFRSKHRVTFLDLFDEQRTKSDLVITFLSILEMVKLGLLSIQQVDPSAEIHLTAGNGIRDAERILADQIGEE